MEPHPHFAHASFTNHTSSARDILTVRRIIINA